MAMLQIVKCFLKITSQTTAGGELGELCLLKIQIVDSKEPCHCPWEGFSVIKARVNRPVGNACEVILKPAKEGNPGIASIEVLRSKRPILAQPINTSFFQGNSSTLNSESGSGT